MKTSLDALRVFAEMSGLPFGRLHHIWRDLQAANEVPKSAGKAYYPPRRKDFAALIAAIGFSAQEGVTVADAVNLARTMTLNGQRMSALERPTSGQPAPALIALTNTLDATSLDPTILQIEFDAGAKIMRFIRLAEDQEFSTPKEPHRDRGWTIGDDRILDQQDRNTFTPIRQAVIIDGEFLLDFATAVEWQDHAIPRNQA